MKSIQILITSSGETRLETLGFVGPACREASRFLEQALGQPLTEESTPAFHQSTPATQRLSEE
ncbi:MAG: DUF2997 domain-containing protein [Planctomycetaceae bacterium]|nr:DUF2997 domain-containing protein [Planctomycetaceae bacterium]MCB1041268.1 DUF2997 domain-containing protein [Acidimicrobiales bacterium]